MKLKITEYDRALLYVIESVFSAQLRYNLRAYQVYELVKEVKLRIKFQKFFNDRILQNEKFIIEQEN